MKYYEKNQIENWDKAIEEAAQVIRKGGLVAFPTETVYGLGADAQNEQAVQKIYVAKGRPADNPLIVHIAHKEDLMKIAKDISDWVLHVTEKYWPGPLSVVLNRREDFCSAASAGLSTVAVRMPDHETALALIERSERYLAAPSANISGRLSPTKGRHVAEDMREHADIILAQDDLVLGLESTVIDARGSYPVILRTGCVTCEMLAANVGRAEIYDAAAEKPLLPGMKYVHYRPRATVMIVDGNLEEKSEKIQNFLETEIKTGIFCSEKLSKNIQCKDVVTYRSLNEAAQKFYATLREFDEKGCRKILCEKVEQTGIGEALVNRMENAAEGRYL